MVDRKKRSSQDQEVPVALEIVDVEKRKGLTKYYVYIVKVTRKNGTEYFVCRSFNQFSEMQSHLEQRFLIEAGAINAKDRSLPNLPSKIYLGRSAIREVTDKRVPLLNDYLAALFALPNNIRYDSIVMAFLRPTSEDEKYFAEMEPAAETKPASPPRRPPPPRTIRPPDRPAGSPSVRRPPPPNAPLPPRPVPPKKVLDESSSKTIPKQKSAPSVLRAKALYSYSAKRSDELSFSEGTILTIISHSGQWYEARLNGKTGLVPANYIEVLSGHDSADRQESGHQSDEWDDDAEKEALTYYFYDEARTVDTDKDVLDQPTMPNLQRLIRGHMKQRDIVLNYKDRTGDFIEITDQDDLEMMKREARGSSWVLYVTRVGDHQVYNVYPYS